MTDYLKIALNEIEAKMQNVGQKIAQATGTERTVLIGELDGLRTARRIVTLSILAEEKEAGQ